MNGILNQRPHVRAAALLAVTTLALGACKKGGSTDPQAGAAGSGAPQATIVGPENIAVAKMERLEQGPVVSGSLTPQKQADVRAQASGAVLQTLVEQGQAVSAGQLLARIDDSAVRDQVLSARSGVASAQASADVSGRDLERAQRLLEAGAVATRDVENARSQNTAARAALDAARARLVSAQQAEAYTQVRAPFAGVVSTRAVSAGSVVAPGAAMFTVVQPGSLQLEAAVPAEQAGAVRLGQTVRFRVNGYGDRVFEGKVTRVNPVADPSTRQVRLMAEIPNGSGQLIGGTYAEGRVETEGREALAVPQSAVVEQVGAATVTRLRGGKAEKVTVRLGMRDSETQQVEVASGLAAGDTLLVGGAAAVTPGTVVRVQAVPSEQTGVGLTTGASAGSVGGTAGAAPVGQGGQSSPSGGRSGSGSADGRTSP